VTTRRPKHAGPYDEHDDRLWRDRRPLNSACGRCNTVNKGRYRAADLLGRAEALAAEVPTLRLVPTTTAPIGRTA
jgi:hypothetical protein